MLDHITICVADFKKSENFHEKVLGTLGIKKLFNYQDSFAGFGIEKCFFWVGASDSEHPVSPNVHVAFVAKSKSEVEEFYKVAIENGAIDNGKPGYRKEYAENYYACFVKDFDNNNIEGVFRE